MQEGPTPRRAIEGSVASNGFVQGMILTLRSTLDSLTADDIILLSTPNGGFLTLYPESVSRHGIVVSAMVKPVEFRQFILRPIDDWRWYLEMKAEDARLQQSGNF